jgi:integrase
MSDLRIPSYRLHKARGLAAVELSGETIYLGKHGSPESKANYEKQIAEWLARGRTSRPRNDGKGISVNEVMLAYVQFAETYYKDSEGCPTREIESMKLAFRPLKAIYGHTPAADFGPRTLEAVQTAMIESKLSRRVINQRIGYVKRMFKWASRKELIEPATYHRLLCVDGLRRGRSNAKETAPIEPVPDAHVDAIIPYLPPTLAAMVQIHQMTGMRSGELVRLRLSEIDMSIEKKEGVWLYKPIRHKTAYLGKKRVIPLGPQCIALLRPYFKLETTAYLFNPKQAQAERDAIRRAQRKTRVQPSQFNRKKPKRKHPLGDAYNTRSYHAALRFAMKRAEKAGTLARGEFWHPHRLRHRAAERTRHDMGLEAARALLGHSKADMTEHYAGQDTALAIVVAQQCG